MIESGETFQINSYMHHRNSSQTESQDVCKTYKTASQALIQCTKCLRNASGRAVKRIPVLEASESLPVSIIILTFTRKHSWIGKHLVVSLPCGHWALNIVHLPAKCYPVSFELLDHIQFKVFLSSDLEEQSGYVSPFLWLFAVTRLIWVHISGFQSFGRDLNHCWILCVIDENDSSSLPKGANLLKQV